MSDNQRPLFPLFRDDAAIKNGRQIRPKRHARKPGGDLACGHKPLPSDGAFIQYPLSMRALLAVVDCPTCRKWLMAKAANRVVTSAREGFSNTPPNGVKE